MKDQIYLTLYLDNRRKKAEGKYPVKLRLYDPRTTKERLFRTGFDFTEEEFKQVYSKIEPEKTKTNFLKDKSNQLN